MELLGLLAAAVATGCIAYACVYIFRQLSPSYSDQAVQHATSTDHLQLPTDPGQLARDLATAIPGSVILPYDERKFRQALTKHWAQQECEAVPNCILRPHDADQLSTALQILTKEYDRVKGSRKPGVFAIRSGGHSPVSGAASMAGGVLVDLCEFNEITLSQDRKRVAIGAGCRWIDVYRTLESQGLAVVGGRNSEVGVGGLILGGGLSFFSPQYGFVCDNVSSYDILLASGEISSATTTHNSDLFRALKGGGNNFGVITRFTLPTFACEKIWSGFLYLPSNQAQNVLSAFHAAVEVAGSPDCDKNAAGPIASFSYVQNLGFQLLAVNLVHTAPPQTSKTWPKCWKKSGFASLWRLWSTTKLRTLSSATDELSALNPAGRRQCFAMVTIKNDAATLAAVHSAYEDAIVDIKKRKVKDMVWTIVLQPLVPQWSCKGTLNPFGLQNSSEAMVVVSFTVNWALEKDDKWAKQLTKASLERMEHIAKADGTYHRFKYTNYCAEWQKPFEGYGDETVRFLRDTSRKYDPNGLFQKGCAGGFKIFGDDG